MPLTAPYLGRSESVDLDEAIFGDEFHEALAHAVARAELNAKRRGTHSTKTRGEVKMTTAKAFRQKGTGRARAGALSTPQRIGGGVAFGPKPRSYVVKVNRKARRRALRSVLSLHAGRGTLAVVDPADFPEPSTRRAAEALDAFGSGRALVVLSGDGETSCRKSFRNLAKATATDIDATGVADIVGAARLVVSAAALERLAEIARAPERSAPEEVAA